MNYFHTTFAELGLNESDVDVLLLLMKNHELTVPDMVELSGYSRTTVYDSLNNLEQFNLIQSRKEKREVYYRGAPPDHIRELIDAKKRNSSILIQHLEQCLSEIVELYSATNETPEMDVFHGVVDITASVKQLSQRLSSPVDIVVSSSFIDSCTPECMDVFTSTAFHRRIVIEAQHQNQNAKQQNVIDAPTNEVRYSIQPIVSPGVAMLIFPTSTLYIKQAADHTLVATLLTDQSISTLHRSLFQSIWT